MRVLQFRPESTMSPSRLSQALAGAFDKQHGIPEIPVAKRPICDVEFEPVIYVERELDRLELSSEPLQTTKKGSSKNTPKKMKKFNSTCSVLQGFVCCAAVFALPVLLWYLASRVNGIDETSETG